jgi:3-methyladenine DNA glycosylase AlkD
LTARSAKQNALTADQVLAELRAASEPGVTASLSAAGITTAQAYGVRVGQLLSIARQTSPSHDLAAALWQTGIYEARIVAAMVDRPEWVTDAQMETWAEEFDSWAVCDTVCSVLFDRTPHAVAKAATWSSRPEEFVKRAGFALMSSLALHDRSLDNATFEAFLPLIEAQAWDDRNLVKKAVNWALRQIGKRNLALNARARSTAEHIHLQDTRTAHWIAADAIRELQSPAVMQRLEKWSHDPKRP